MQVFCPFWAPVGTVTFSFSQLIGPEVVVSYILILILNKTCVQHKSIDYSLEKLFDYEMSENKDKCFLQRIQFLMLSFIDYKAGDAVRFSSYSDWLFDPGAVDSCKWP